MFQKDPSFPNLFQYVFTTLIVYRVDYKMCSYYQLNKRYLELQI